MEAQFSDFATATQAISLTPQQSLAVQDAGRLNANLLDSFEDQDMQSMTFNAYAYSLNWTQTGCYRPGALPVALAMNDTCMPGFHCKYVQMKMQLTCAYLIWSQARNRTTNTHRNTVHHTRFARRCALWVRLVTPRVCSNLRYAQTVSTARTARTR